ncbi:MAG: trans-aconitate 2-methyltransferase [Desulfuromonadia bacterium]
MGWDPDQYHRFTAPRFAPFDDLVSMITIRPALSVVDLGCGTGELTERLARLLPDSRVLGIDASDEMLQRAFPLSSDRLRFKQGRIEDLEGEYDLIFSHAALHWLPDHPRLIPRLIRRLRTGGEIACQIPANHNHPAHRVIREIARSEPFRTVLSGWYHDPSVLPIDRYAELLFREGMEGITVLEKIYPVVLPDGESIAEWTEGSTLVPYRDRMDRATWENFLATYRRHLHHLFPGKPVYYTFRRILFAARRP